MNRGRPLLAARRRLRRAARRPRPGSHRRPRRLHASRRRAAADPRGPRARAVETIHPFADGNGRTGRALIHALLRRRRLTRSLTVPVSAGLLVDTGAYFDALTAYRDGDPAPIVDVVAAATHDAVVNGRVLLADLRAIRAEWRSDLKARADSSAWPLLDLVLRQPVVQTALVQRELGISHTNAMRAIERVVAAGALVEVGGRRRSVLWQSTQVLSALDRFAARAGRRALGEARGPG